MTKSIGRLATLFALLTPLSSFAIPVQSGEVQWRQVTETTGFTWEQVASVCDPSTGACAGTLGEVDFDGWTWASIDDVGGLFQELSGYLFDQPSNYSQAHSSWAPAFFEYFDPSYVYQARSGIYGWARDLSATSSAYAFRPYVYDSELHDYISTNIHAGASSYWSAAGVWLYRQATPVSGSGTLALFALGAFILGLRRR